ncbi:HPr family phosphocarrier protein [Rubinisphaera italica]|uniref:Phosphocarrier protein HPr n=1 Tax=Rubinisphaera italica TaxID=2527969 RepID=A0A5C5XD47_9PLAN|nr:HPr family phosphocarrier protein [Rubinisphaera italica]TWT61016.1 Phosphocarrier protein HPr [Rubinisphaera italica]HBN76450.1 HPr family phosphocarrier protein [Planctomycetaceae bacterium]|tara:strand:+ start:2931 stop:3251 length:321 start_codon:yes stop_codon:yes gene_type:complete
MMEPRHIEMGDLHSCSEEVIVNLEHGLHLVPCSKIAELARSHECEIHIRKLDQVVDAKAVFDLMTLRADQGTHLIIEAEGPFAEQAVQQMRDLFENDFYVDRSRPS